MATDPTPGQPPSDAITEKPPEAVPPAPNDAITAAPPAQAPVTPTPLAPSTLAQPRPWVLKVDIAIFALLLVLTFFVGSFVATNSDVWLHLAIGKSISEGKFTFGEDPYSWVTEADGDQPAAFWVHQSWLYSWALYQLYQIVGGPGLVIIKALLITGAIVLLTRIGWSEPNRWFILISMVIAAVAISPRLMLQPIAVSFLFLTITLYVISRAGFFNHASADGKAPCPRVLWALPPLFALWANLDAWFILGPIVVGLCWLGAGLARWFPGARVVPAKTLGLVFGACVLACLVNPYHVRVFQLPPELSYVVVSMTDAIHLQMPDAVVGAGRTINELKKGDGEAGWTIPALSMRYFWDPRVGRNIAGFAFFPMIILGLLGFTLTARIKAQPGAPTFHVGRFVLWLVFAVLALALFRMIPFFILIAAPLTAMTLGEFLRWQQAVTDVPIARRDRGLNLARIVSILFILLLILLAWPGWLQGAVWLQGGTDIFASLRRVAWDVKPNPSLERAALVLGELKKEGKGNNVFNTSYDLADYLPWFAPGVKFGLDNRLALYAGRVSAYTKARGALESSDVAGWRDYFVKHNVDQIALTNFVKRDPRDKNRYMSHVHWWVESDTRRMREGDNRAVIFSWAGPDKTWPSGSQFSDWNREAFGPVPENRRPPKDGVPVPPPQDLLSLYSAGAGPTPVGVYEYVLLSEQHNIAGDLLNLKVIPVCRTGMFASLVGAQVSAAGVTIVPATIIAFEQLQFMPRCDSGLAALPVLMVRSARRAAGDNPQDAQCRIALTDAVSILRQQEDRWVGSYSPGKLRERIRQLQIINGRYAAAQLAPDNPDNHFRLAEIYFNEKLYDLVLDHMQAAEKALEIKKSASPEEQKEIDVRLKACRSEVQMFDKMVRQRLAKWKELSVLPPGDKLSATERAVYKARVAALGNMDEVFGGRQVQSPLGLGKKAMEILGEIKDDSTSLEAQRDALFLQYQLLLSMGRADKVLESLQDENIKKALPPDAYASWQIQAAGAMGDYAAMDSALAVIEGNMQQGMKLAKAASAPAIATYAPCLIQVPQMGSGAAVAEAFILQSLLPMAKIQEVGIVLQFQHNELSNVITFRGICALEAGNTEHARVLFQRAIDQAGDYFFTERPIAQRYLDLLKQQKR